MNGDKKSGPITFCVSLGIEVLQLITGLGSFEVDDLIHNTLGAWLGAMVWKRIGTAKIEWKTVWKYCVGITAVMLVLSVSCSVGLSFSHHQKMVAYAALSDMEGKKNLLILDGKDGYTRNGDVYVKYLDDGSLSIKGKTESRSWFPIGNITLEPGKYVFAGLSGVDIETVAIKLEYKNQENKYVRMIVDVGAIESVRFILKEPTAIRAYVTVYPGCDCKTGDL